MSAGDPAPPPPPGTLGRRLAAVLAVAGVVLAVAVADRAARRPVPAPFGVEQPAGWATPAAARSSTWFCPGGRADDQPGALAVVVGNATDQPRTGTVTWVPSDGPPVRVPLEVRSAAAARLAAGDALDAPFAAATVELDGGGVVVEQTVTSGGGGMAVAPCASAATPQAFVAYGSTERDSTNLLFLYNPFPDDTIVDITFATDEGRADPAETSGLVIEAGRVEVVDLTQVVRRRAAVAVTVTARRGRVAVARLQRFDGSEGRTGTAVALAAPEPSRTWFFAHGRLSEGRTERYHLYNPGEAEALVDLDVVLDEGDAQPEPIELSVPPRSAVAVDLGADGRVPAGAGFSVSLRSLNDVGVVAEREVVVGSGPARVAAAPGAARAARRWGFALGAPGEGAEATVGVVNVGAEETAVELRAGGQPLGGVGPLRPAGRAVVPLDGPATSPVVVEAEAEVAADRALGPSAAYGPGIPLP